MTHSGSLENSANRTKKSGVNRKRRILIGLIVTTIAYFQHLGKWYVFRMGLNGRIHRTLRFLLVLVDWKVCKNPVTAPNCLRRLWIQILETFPRPSLASSMAFSHPLLRFLCGKISFTKHNSVLSLLCFQRLGVSFLPRMRAFSNVNSQKLLL